MVNAKLEKSASKAARALDMGHAPFTNKEFNVLWPKIRLGILLCILIPLSIFGFFRMRYTNAITAIHRALVNYDNLKALELLKNFEKTQGKTAESYFLKARAYRHLGDELAFMQQLELANQLGYPVHKLESERLLHEAQSGMLGDSLALRMQQLMIEPDIEFEEVASSMIYGYLDSNNVSKVFPVLEVWHQQDPRTPWVPFFYGMLAQYNRDWPKSLQAFEDALKFNSEFIPAYRQIGVSYQNVNEHEKAVVAFEKYLRSVPNETEVTSLLGHSLITLGRADEALEFLVPLIESNQANDSIRTTVAGIYLDRNEPQKAVDLLGSVATLWPEDVTIASLMSRAHQKLGNEEQAARFSSVAQKGQVDLQGLDARLSELQSGNGNAQKCYELGHILLHKKSREEGIVYLKQALLRDANHINAIEDIILYFERTNQTEMANKYQIYLNGLKGNP